MGETAPLTDAEAPRVLAEIDRLYHLLERMPYKAKPAFGGTFRASGAYSQIEIDIKALADRYREWEARQPKEKCRMAKATLRPHTTDDDDDHEDHARRKQNR